MPLSFAVIPTHNRREMLFDLVRSLDVDHVVVVDNATDPPVTLEEVSGAARGRAHVIHIPDQPPNLYWFWNVGFDFCASLSKAAGATTWDVAVLNDDTKLPAGWYKGVSEALRAGQAVIACGSESTATRVPHLKTSPVRWPRMTPHAFLMKGEARLRADPAFRWWYGDTDIDFQASVSGGLLIIPGHIAVNQCANSTTVGPLAEQAGRDGETFVRKWGHL